jgi:peptide/nickel transport system substrate-binding protein
MFLVTLSKQGGVPIADNAIRMPTSRVTIFGADRWAKELQTLFAANEALEVLDMPNKRSIPVFVLVTFLLLVSLTSIHAQETLPIETVRIGLSGSVVTFDSAVGVPAPTYQVSVLVGGQLFRFDQERNPVPDLVDTYEVSDDGLQWTMNLHSGLTYSDGTPLSSEDVVYTWDRIKESPAVHRALILNVTGIEAIDEDSVVWTLSSPEPDFLLFFGNHFFMVHPKAQIEADPEAYWANPVSAGPYMLDGWTPGSTSAMLVENPNYIHGPMSIQRIEVLSVPDLTSRTLQLAQGDLDYVFDLPPSIRSVIAEDVTTFTHGLGGNYIFVFNTRLPQFQDPRVREAISLAIDRQQVGERAFFGVMGQLTGPGFGNRPENLIAYPDGWTRDVERARELLAEAGVENLEFQLTVWGGRPGWRDATLVIKQNLEEIGVIANIDSVEDAVGLQRLRDGQFETSWAGNNAWPPIAYLDGIYGTISYSTWSGYDDPEIRELFAEYALAGGDPDRRVELALQIQEIGLRDNPVLVIGERFVLSGTRIPNELLTAVSPGEYLRVLTLQQAQEM